MLGTICWKEISRQSNKERPTEVLRERFKDLSQEAFTVLLKAFEEGPACVAPALYGPGATLPAEIHAHATSRCTEINPGMSLSDALLSNPGLATEIASFAADRVDEGRREGRRHEVSNDSE